MISGTRYQLQREVNRQLRLATDVARAQAEISTGKRILAPSDDPVGAARVADIGRTQANQDTWRTNLDSASALASNAEGVLAALTSAFDRVNELMLRASNATLSAENRSAIALELESIAEEVATLRDTRDSRGEPLFASASAAIRIPVGVDLAIAAVGTRESIFESADTPAGTRSLTAILDGAVNAVRSGNPAAIAGALDQTNAGTRHIISAHGEQGSRGARIETLRDRLEGYAIELEEERSSVESADIMEVVARLQSRKLSLDAAQATFARINRSTLFDLLS
ncbi:MAG TPA: flagellin-like protein [Allosphingosinicella sp.]|jgi:flagellar hook-associated protein 3 FlgL